jgi:GNAT superfamily N-acetyltransferase
MSTAAPLPTVRTLTHATPAELQALVDLLIDCVEGGASVSFMHPLSPDRARGFWERVLADAQTGLRVLHVVDDAQGIVGTVQVILDLPENQPHRAEVSKMLVHRRARKQGLGAVLMQAAHASAAAHGKTLLVLDTSSPEAERLYTRMGWQRVGEVPDFALLPHGGLCKTTFFYRTL